MLGALCILVSELFFASMGATVKAVSEGLPNEMTVFMRNLFGLFILLPLAWHNGISQLRTGIIHLHLVRAIAGLAAMYCFFYALAHLPLAEGMLLKMTVPLFMPLIAWYWMSEGVTKFVLLAIGFGFVGVILVLNPHGEFNLVALIGLLGGLLASLAKVTVRRLGHTEPSVRVVFYFSLLSTLVSAMPALWNWQTPNSRQWILLLLIGLFGTLGLLFLTRGYAIAAAATVSPFTYFSVIFGALYGYLLWDERLSLQFIVGALIIAAAGMLTLRSRHRAAVPLLSRTVES